MFKVGSIKKKKSETHISTVFCFYAGVFLQHQKIEMSSAQGGKDDETASPKTDSSMDVDVHGGENLSKSQIKRLRRK
jgi:hypothetical protein